MSAAYLVLTRRRNREKEWRLFLDFLACGTVEPDKPATILCLGRHGLPGEDPRLETDFEGVAERIEAALKSGADLTVFVDEIGCGTLDALERQGWGTLAARLVLAFPEVRFLFSGAGRDQGLKSHGVAEAFKTLPSPLFDATGLRELVKKRARDGGAGLRDVSRKPAAYLPERKHLALAFDEERAYADFHAYTAYRFGFRAGAVMSDATARELLRVPAAELFLTVEDMFLQYADAAHGKSRLRDRHKEDGWQGVEAVRYRIFVTSGQKRSLPQERFFGNKAYIRELREEPGRYSSLVLKPYAGMFQLWHDAGLLRKLRRPGSSINAGYAPDFAWPPGATREDDQSLGHSSPGALMAIAQRLIERAARSLPDVATVHDALRGAALATEALELLGCRTPTLSLEALRLKHQFEVLAECHFAGIEHHFQLALRVQEIQRDVEAISEWFSKKQEGRAALNAELAILMELVRVFRDFGQFDEELFLMNRVRELQHTLYLRARPLLYPISPLFWYGRVLLRSLTTYCAALMVWLMALTGIFAALPKPGATSGRPVTYPVSQAVAAFFNIGDLKDQQGLWFAALALAGVSGIAHLGIFLSHLYTSMSRR